MLASSTLVNRYITNFAGLSTSCWQGIVLVFIEAALGGICFFLSIYFVEIVHLDVTTSGIILSFYGLGKILGGLIGGKLSDKFSPAKIAMLGLFLEGLSCVALLKLKTSYLLMLTMFVLGAASYGFITSNNLWVLSQCANHEKLKAINLLTVASNLGIGVSALIMSILSSYGFQYYIALDAICFFIFAIYSLSIHKEEKNCSKKEFELQQSIQSSDNQTQKSKTDKAILWMTLTFLFVIGIIVVQTSTTSSIFINTIFPQYGMNGITFLFGINTILIILFQAPVVNLFNPYNKLLITGLAGFLIGFSMFMLTYSFLFAFVILAWVIYTIGEMLFFSNAQLICYEHAQEGHKGRNLGMFRMTYAASVTAGPTLGSYVYTYASPNLLWYICGALGVVCFIVCYRFRYLISS